MELERADDHTDVRRTLRALRRRKWWVALPVGLAVGVSLLATGTQDEVYEAAARVRFVDPADISLFREDSGGARTPSQLAATEIETAHSFDVRAAVVERLGSRYRRVSSLRAGVVGETTVLELRAHSTDPIIARAAADAFAEAYMDVRGETLESAILKRAAELRKFAEDTASATAALDQEIATLDKRIAELESAGATADRRAEISTLGSRREQLVNQRALRSRSQEDAKTRADELQLEAGLQSSTGAHVIQQAGLPSSPVSPTPARDATVAAVLGLLLGLGSALGREYLDDRIRGEDDVRDVLASERAAPLPLLGSTPVLRARAVGDRLVALCKPQSPEAESYRLLRTNVEYANASGDLRVLLVTSAVEAEGKSTTAANLAAALAIAGQRVVAVDFDLRRPCLPELFGVPGEVGLTSVLLGRTLLEAALVPVEVSAGSLRVLAAGPAPPNPAEVLGSARVGEVVDRLRARADYVIIDAPPVLPVSDTLEARRWADSVLVVARAGVTRGRRLREALGRLEQTDTSVLGVLLAAAPPSSNAQYTSSYYTRGGRVADGAHSAEEWRRVLSGTNGRGRPADVRSAVSNRGAEGRT